MPDLEAKKTGDGNNTLSISTEENWSDSLFHTCVIPDSYLPVLYSYFESCWICFSADGGNCSLQDSCPQSNTNGTQLSSNVGDTSIPDSHPRYDTAGGCNENGEASDVNIPADQEPVEAPLSSMPQSQKREDMPDLESKKTGCGDKTLSISTENRRMSVQYDNNDSLFDTCEIPDSYVPVSCSQFDTCGIHFSADGGNCNLQDSCPQCNTNGTQLPANGGDSFVPDLHPQYDTAEGCDENGDSSEVESRVDRWACRVCKVETVSIAVLPCSHLCLCWECESETDSCPICGEAKTDCFYVRSD